MKKILTAVLVITSMSIEAKRHYEVYDEFTLENLIPEPESGVYLQVLYRTNLNTFHGADSEIGITLIEDMGEQMSGRSNLKLHIREYINPETSNYLQYEFVNKKLPNIKDLKSKVRTKSYIGDEVCKTLVEVIYELGELRLNDNKNATGHGLGFVVSSSNTEVIVKASNFNGLYFEITETHGNVFKEWFYDVREAINNCAIKQHD